MEPDEDISGGGPEAASSRRAMRAWVRRRREERNMLLMRRPTVALLVVLALMALFLLAGCSKSGSANETSVYQCPMHPQVISDKPGDCPICGMKLVLVKKPAETNAVQAKAPLTPKTMWHSTMNANEVSDHPGKDSMGMEMVPFETEAPAAAGVPGLAPVSVTKERQQQINLSTSVVEMRRISREVRTTAAITPDETRLYSVTTKVGGWVERLYVDTTGQAVLRGQPLLTIYSPELLATQEEYLAALSSAKQLSQSNMPSVAQGGRDIMQAARRRLELWDVSNAQIKALEESGKARKDMTLYSPATGYVSQKTVLPGQKIAPGDPLLTVSDLSTVWAEADIHESDARFVKTGMPVTLTLPYWPGKTFPGKISFLDPFLDPQTRTLKARLEIPNRELLLKPAMYGDMTLSYDLGERLSVPVSAVMPTGRHDFVFIESNGQEFTPAEVTLGDRSEGYYEVPSGLKAGDRVVTSANFLIDSESSLKAALQAVTEGR